ncbi:MAG: hypothetical protein OXE92_08105 [Bacteroidetes bacterium]|nr:hypothetical protein [Bacteroidota bacterium]MCY4205670.1 hypothetical protein [Bacteroidota bacterium]
MKDGDINYTREAFLHPWNLSFLTVGIGVALGLGFVGLGELGNTLFQSLLTLTVAFELLILGYLPRQRRFRNIIRAKHAAVAAKPPSQREMYRQLNRVNQRRYVRLRDLEKDVQANYRKFSYASQGILESHTTKIEDLMNSCLKLMFQQERYTAFGQRKHEQELITAIAAVETELKHASEPIRKIKVRRLKVLEQRLQRFKQSKEQLEMIEAQVATIEDVVKYIHEQSLTLNNPEEITYQLDVLLSEVEETEASVSQIESVFGVEESEDDWNSPLLRSRSRS